MSIYPAPKLRDGVLNSVFNSADYIKDTGGGGLSLAQTDALYLKNSGVVVSSANTTFNGTVDIGALCTVDNINVITALDTVSANITGLCTVNSLKANTSLDATTITASGLCSVDSLKATTSLEAGTITTAGLCSAGSLKATTSLEAGTITALLATIDTLTVSTLKAKNSSDTLTADFWRTDQVYSYTNSMVYSLISDDAVVNSVSFINVPTTTNQTYIFTFIMQPSTVNSLYYIKPSSNTININGASIELYGLQNVSLPANYTFLVQQISIIYDVYYGKQFFALTSVSAY
jgi:hypothetical protein